MQQQDIYFIFNTHPKRDVLSLLALLFLKGSDQPMIQLIAYHSRTRCLLNYFDSFFFPIEFLSIKWERKVLDLLDVFIMIM